MSNYLTEDELNVVKGLLHYLNDNMDDSSLKPDIDLIDGNGEKAGRIEFNPSAQGYVLQFG